MLRIAAISAISLIILTFPLSCSGEQSEMPVLPQSTAFAFDLSLTLPGLPEAIYHAVTADISGWWDHTFSEKPAKFYLEARPGGGFYEIFDKTGDGVLHATVIFAQRGKRLTLDGPLGLSGKAVTLVSTFTFDPTDGDSTLIKLSVHGSGELEKGTPEIIQRVWHHFLFEGLKPYVEAGRHLAAR
jgi:uncharacterized protein YndB with AHSA1/START domain